ncbi:putative carbohydrate uptake ABC transporter permease protein [Gottschalkia acidurici 9a]|uniref:Carbohydrate uptake ABC transporter permease protein n=1 Tax=Gottschalkia acidurici (strain ATCC 7906 / DSM 604 / BCRC 14475 / CIP 104303 / KCTC 5404 / NCIMB 10678 / 9a) TaxID=1128398 RepID=K0B3K7_GOTA9|nr:sugar ABC transporter permease [Gottschalkia acidurici]AFS79435.1 putative carbohydrate uptake ABC transporter permease protein [Gottschalkia acidurici 9a]
MKQITTIRKLLKSKELKALIYLLPSLLIITVFQIYPIIKSLVMSFYTDFDYLTDTVYKRGLDNFQYVLTDHDFYLSLKNTFIFVLGVVPLSIVVSLGFAILLNSNIKLKNFFRSIYFITFITSIVAVSTVWRWMFNQEFGLVNSILIMFGIDKINWLTNPKLTIPILILLNVWKGMGYKIVIFLAGLQNIDEKYYLAAKIDGASVWKRFRSITLPLLSPTLFFVSITSVIGSFKIFDEVFILYDKQTGPLKSGLTIVYYIFNKFYRHWQFSIAAAAAFVLFIIILIFTLIQLKIGKKNINY